jgi:hypothetical protein
VPNQRLLLALMDLHNTLEEIVNVDACLLGLDCKFIEQIQSRSRLREKQHDGLLEFMVKVHSCKE